MQAIRALFPCCPARGLGIIAAMRHPAFAPLRRPLAVALLAGAALAAQAETLPCRVDPFGGESAAERAAMLARGCGGERVDYRLESLRDKPTDPGPSRVAAGLDAITSRPLGDLLLGTVRLNWSGAGSEAAERLLRTQRTAWAAGTWWKLDSDWALQMNVGREFTDGPRTRATLAGVWRPVRGAVMFAEWASTPEGPDGQRIGMRWWLVRNRLSLEAGARRLADTGWDDRQVRLNWGLLR
jgi:hypothetical protein